MRSKSSAEHDVFISYAHEDHEFVRMLKGWLEAAGFDVWLDKERMRAGRPVQAEIYAALKRSRRAVFVLSESWVRSEWGGWELATFLEERGNTGKGIPILRTPLPKGRIPVNFTQALRIDWFERNRVSDDACFWQLYCALRGWSPEEEDSWDWMGRTARSSARQGGGSVLLSRTEVERAKRDANRTRFGPSRAALRCDRKPQWDEVESRAGLKRHEAFFVQGADHESPELFLEALRNCYPEPQARVVPVAWDSERLPQTKAQFLDELTSALGCGRGSLVQTLRDELRRHPLVLVHRPQLPAVLRSDTLARYYTRHLPDLISQLGQTHEPMKIFQGIVWSDTEQTEAERRIRAIPAHCELPIVVLPPLEPITLNDIDAWSKNLPSGTDPGAAVARILLRATSSAEILRRIIAEYGQPGGTP